MKTSLVILAALALAGAAHATQPGNNGNGQGGCGVGQQTNGCGTPSTGGQGGAGGSATSVSGAAAIAGAAAGAVSGSHSDASVRNSGNSASNSTAAGGAGGSATSSAQGGAGGSSRADGGQASAVGSVTINGDHYEAARIPVATAYAAPLAASNGTCMGSTSAGVQGMSAGLSFGTTWTDNGCDARYDATALVAAGQPKAAIARLCLKAEIRQAMADAGTPCPGAQQRAAIGGGSSDAPAAQVAYTDPIIRQRLGLPPLGR